MFNKKQWKNIDKISGWLVVVGAINWGFGAMEGVGWIKNDMIAWLADATVQSVGTFVYSAIALAGVLVVFRSLSGKFMK